MGGALDHSAKLLLSYRTVFPFLYHSTHIDSHNYRSHELLKTIMIINLAARKNHSSPSDSGLGETLTVRCDTEILWSYTIRTEEQGTRVAPGTEKRKTAVEGFEPPMWQSRRPSP